MISPVCPCYIVRQEVLDGYIRDMLGIMESFAPGSAAVLPMKNCSMPWLISYMKKRGIHSVQVSSPAEIQTALAMGFSPEDMIYTGILKDAESFGDTLASGGQVYISSFREIEWLSEMDRKLCDVPYEIGIQITWDLSEGKLRGFSAAGNDLEPVLRRLWQLENIRITGIFMEMAPEVPGLVPIDSVMELCEKYRLDIRRIFLGDPAGTACDVTTPKNMFKNLRTLSENMELRVRGSHGRTGGTNRINKGNLKIFAAMPVPILRDCIRHRAQVIEVREVQGVRHVFADTERYLIEPFCPQGELYPEVMAKVTPVSEECGPDIQIIYGFDDEVSEPICRLKGEPEIRPGDMLEFKGGAILTQSRLPERLLEYPAVYAQLGDELFLLY